MAYVVDQRVPVTKFIPGSVHEIIEAKDWCGAYKLILLQLKVRMRDGQTTDEYIYWMTSAAWRFANNWGSEYWYREALLSAVVGKWLLGDTGADFENLLNRVRASSQNMESMAKFNLLEEFINMTPGEANAREALS